jgi:hypothetical protein
MKFYDLYILLSETGYKNMVIQVSVKSDMWECPFPHQVIEEPSNLRKSLIKIDYPAIFQEYRNIWVTPPIIYQMLGGEWLEFRIFYQIENNVVKPIKKDWLLEGEIDEELGIEKDFSSFIFEY